MDIRELFNRPFLCDCGKEHHLPIFHYEYSDQAIQTLPGILQKHRGASIEKITVVSDIRTWVICGQEVHEAVSTISGAANVIVPDVDQHSPICNPQTCQWLQDQIPRDTQLVIAVGSGVINDLCKWASFELDLPYLVAATAASMNGYAAANVAPSVNGVKILVRARPPIAVLAQPEVIETAPYEMTAAGFGDMTAKFLSHADWRMNHFLLDEYYCSFCSRLVEDLEPLYLSEPSKIVARERGAIGGLFEALFRAGAAMTLVGTSAPASGGEHLLSHTLDMISTVRGISHDLHGRQVGLGVIFSAALYEKILSLPEPQWHALPEKIDKTYWQDQSVIQAVSEQYQAKKDTAGRIQEKLSDRQTWDQFKQQIRPLIKPPQQIKKWLESANAAHCVEHIGFSHQQVLDAALHMHEIRKRFTIVDLAWMLGILPAAAEEIIDQWLT